MPGFAVRVGPEGYIHGWIKAGVGPGHTRVLTVKGRLMPALTGEQRRGLKNSVAQVRKKLSAAQLKTVEQWTSGKGMVRRIQTGKASEATKKAFDEAMHEAPKVDGLVYRGVKPGSELAKLADRLRPGATLRLDEPVSTSIDPHQAGAFGSYMFEIDSPAAAYIAGIGSKYAYEEEAVLAPGSFRVVSVETVMMHIPPHGVFPQRVIKLQDISEGSRSWRHIPRKQLKTAATGLSRTTGPASSTRHRRPATLRPAARRRAPVTSGLPSGCTSTGCTARARRRSAGAKAATSTAASWSSASTSRTPRATARRRTTTRSASGRRHTQRKSSTQEGRPWPTRSRTAT